MTNGPYRAHNPNVPCMIDGNFYKKYPRDLLQETVENNHAYPKYHRIVALGGIHKFYNCDAIS